MVVPSVASMAEHLVACSVVMRAVRKVVGWVAQWVVLRVESSADSLAAMWVDWMAVLTAVHLVGH